MQVRFGDFTLDTDSRQLRCGENERHLTPKAFELLCLLVEERPRAVSKTQLHHRLWPATFVSEATLSSLVAEVRDALGERAYRRRFIRTVHRFGYAFDGDATEIGSTRPAPGRVRCWVVWNAGQATLGDGDHLFGRDGDVAVWLDSPTVSRHHARLSIDGSSATVADLGSKNGTYVRGERIFGPAPVGDGDEIKVGSISITFRLVVSTASTVTQR